MTSPARLARSRGVMAKAYIWLAAALLCIATPGLGQATPLVEAPSAPVEASAPFSTPAAPPGGTTQPPPLPARATPRTPQASPDPSPIRFQLPNGLRVLLAPEAGRPRVAVSIAYHVGERDDPPGYRGLAHVTEHTMFDGMAKG